MAVKAGLNMAYNVDIIAHIKAYSSQNFIQITDNVFNITLN